MTRAPVLVLMLLAIWPAAALADWSKPRRVTGGGANVTDPQPFAVNDEGQMAVAWVDGDIAVRTGRAGRLGRRTYVRPAGAPAGLRLAIGDDGTVAVAWLADDGSEPPHDVPDSEVDEPACCQILHVAVRRAGRRRFDRPQVISVRGRGVFPFRYGLSVGPRGQVAAAWYAGGVEAAFAAPGKRFGPPQELWPYGFGTVVAVDHDPRGRAVVAYKTDGAGATLRAAIRSTRGRLRHATLAPAPQAPTGFSFFDAAVTTSSAGQVIGAWRHTSSSVTGTSDSLWAGSGALMGPLRSEAVTPPGIEPSLAAARNGRAVLAWRADGRIAVARRGRGAAFGPGLALGPGYSSAVAINRRGDSVVLLGGFVGLRSLLTRWGRPFDPSRATLLAREGANLAVAIDRRGRAYAASEGRRGMRLAVYRP